MSRAISSSFMEIPTYSRQLRQYSRKPTAENAELAIPVRASGPISSSGSTGSSFGWTVTSIPTTLPQALMLSNFQNSEFVLSSSSVSQPGCLPAVSDRTTLSRLRALLSRHAIRYARSHSRFRRSSGWSRKRLAVDLPDLGVVTLPPSHHPYVRCHHPDQQPPADHPRCLIHSSPPR